MGSPDDVDNHERTPSSSPPSQQQNTEPSLLDSVKRSPKTVAWCLALSSGIVLYGYDLVIVGNVSSMPEFQKDFGRYLNNNLIIPSLWLGLWNIANPLGGILGSLTAGTIQDRFGRRPSLALASIISAIGVAIAYMSNAPEGKAFRRSIFFIAKLVQGFAVNMIMCTTQTYISEILPKVLRGPVLGGFPGFMLLGQLGGSVVVYLELGEEGKGKGGYKKCFLSQWAFSVIPLIVAVFVPESPAYILRRGRRRGCRDDDEAWKCQRRLVSSDGDADALLHQIRLSIEHETTTTTTTEATCFARPNRLRTTIVLFANLLPTLFGLTLLAKGSYFMQVVGMSAHTSLVFLQVGIALGLLANIGGVAMVARFGRVVLTIWGLVVGGLLWMGMGVVSSVSSSREGGVVIWYTQTSILLLTITTGLTVWPASYVISGEASSLHLRAKTQGLGWLVNCLANGVMGLVLPYIFNEDQGALRGKTGFVYMGFCVLAVGFTWWVVPEMKDLGVGEIDRLFELGWRRV
ncbi:MFS general substrate transporter [Aspergillus cavernicola]|uniref:MFS general substrate transporter n=1 Tax=Aspergillus cavernicola TaxID=176166 RepID=A0ABR4IJU4_9EURO